MNDCTWPLDTAIVDEGSGQQLMRPARSADITTLPTSSYAHVRLPFLGEPFAVVGMLGSPLRKLGRGFSTEALHLRRGQAGCLSTQRGFGCWSRLSLQLSASRGLISLYMKIKGSLPARRLNQCGGPLQLLA